ncbi:hypothetical protein PGC35_14380 [Psychrobacillus sp. PGGUH221]|uniref:hypothetical protein n=1 Tax=Psychrobacillus sp. PGGUH221 TaxID=3020058 RepID=UPI0035C67B44
MELKDYFSEEKLEELRGEIKLEKDLISKKYIGDVIYVSEIVDYVNADVFNYIAHVPCIKIGELIESLLNLKENQISINPIIEVEGNECEIAYVSNFEIEEISNLTVEQKEEFDEIRDEILDLFFELCDELDVRISFSFTEVEAEEEEEEEEDKKVRVDDIW